jgi:mono/diheme cytochrome c family protein
VKGDDAKPITGTTIELEPGIRPFAAKLVRTDKAVRVELRWEGPGFRKEPLPYFFYGHTLKQRPAEYAAGIQKDHGRMLFEEMACVKCHAAGPKTEPLAKTFAERTGPNLAEIGKRAYAGWIDAWLADPAKLRPHTVMPKMFTDDEKGIAERYAVTAYLTSLGGPLPPYNPKTIPNAQERQSFARGEKLYLTAGCATCHGQNLTSAPVKAKGDDPDQDKEPVKPEDTFHSFGAASGPQSHYQLNHVGSKFTPATLAKFLEDPLATNPHGRMPKMLLNGQEAQDIARFLCRVTDEKISTALPPAPKTDPTTLLPDGVVPKKGFGNEQWKAAGKAIFAAKGCANCHAVTPDVKPAATAPKLDNLVWRRRPRTTSRPTRRRRSMRS